MSAIRLISDELVTHIPNPVDKNFQVQKNYVLPRPQGRFTIVGFVSHIHHNISIHPLVKAAIKEDIGVVYVCDKLPSNPINDPHVHYIECPHKWFIHTLFLNPLGFSSVFSSPTEQNLALAFSEFTQYRIPVIKKEHDISTLSKNFEKNKNNVLVEIFGGVGDHLMTIPSLKTLSHKGNKVYVLCDKHRQPCLKNLPYVKGFFSKRSEVDISKFKKIIYLNFGQLLNDYRQDFNKQNRIYAVAELCGFRPEDLVTDRPEIILDSDEIASAQKKWGPYKNKVFLGADSARVDSKIPNSLAQDIINKLKSRGCTVFTTSVRRHSFSNCIDLNKQMTVREMFSLIAMMDCVVTVDTAFLHVAGAFNKKTFCAFNYFKPEWRSSTYQNCNNYIPRTACFPCVAKQFVCSREWQCHRKSCYEFQDWNQIVQDVSEFLIHKKLKVKEVLSINRPIEDSVQPPRKIDESVLPGKVIKVRTGKGKRIAAFWMGGIGDAVMLSYLCRAISRKYPDAQIDAFVRDLNQVQLFVFDYPKIKAQYSNLGWSETIKAHKANYDISYEFGHYPYVWNNYNPELNKPINKEFYSDWKKASVHILNNWNKEIFRYYAEQTDLILDKEDLFIPLPNDSDPYVKSKLKQYKLPDKFISISSGCDQNVGLLKLWPKNKWLELVEKLNKKGETFIQVGSKSDIDLPGVKKVTCTNFIDLMYLLQKSELHISNEGGLVHLAHAVGTRGIVLFGPTRPDLYGYPDNRNIYTEECPSCWWKTSQWSSKCKEGHKSCVNMDGISAHQVYLNILKEIKQ